ncbi:unnamed protein product [Adineta ricciae]|uniref:ZZ-type domain-containing protein n=1 Tax=Adineta ricciae TaxID=249248 RepID=A0A815VES2_ADIRI|nr:unnamed protein product [Adineta ricciae]
MKAICTSCGESIPSSSNIYKCRQCVNHFVCESCQTKEHNRTSANSHTLNKIVSSQVQSVTSTAGSTSPKLATDEQENQSKKSLKSSSIFSSEDYLYHSLGCCSHCYRIVIMDKEPSFQCQQCPAGFGVCAQCMPLMKILHPSPHTFSQEPLSYWTKQIHDFYHLDVKCNGCSMEHFNGNRYQCSQCQSSFNLCENCFKTKHAEHKMKYIQNPFSISINRLSLARRILGLTKKNGERNPDWRDPLTGWTKSDAELVDQQAKKEQENYYNRLQQIEKKIEERAEEERRRTREENAHFQRRLQDMEDDSHRRFMWQLTLN